MMQMEEQALLKIKRMEQMVNIQKATGLLFQMVYLLVTAILSKDGLIIEMQMYQIMLLETLVW